MKITLLALSFILVACSSGKPTAVDQTHTAEHGGTLLKGSEHYVEIVATSDKLKVYPLKVSGAGLDSVPLDKVKGDAKYSFVLAKSDWKVDLDKKTDFMEGKIDAKGEKAISVKLDLKIDGTKESFFHDVPVQD